MKRCKNTKTWILDINFTYKINHTYWFKDCMQIWGDFDLTSKWDLNNQIPILNLTYEWTTSNPTVSDHTYTLATILNQTPLYLTVSKQISQPLIKQLKIQSKQLIWDLLSLSNSLLTPLYHWIKNLQSILLYAD